VVSEINCVPEGCGCRNYHERAQHPSRAALGIFGADGAFAEYAVVPIVNIHAVPASLSDDQAMFVEPLAAACQITQQVHFQSGDRVAVVGTGKLGILIVQAIAAVGNVQVTAFGRRDVNFRLCPLRAVLFPPRLLCTPCVSSATLPRVGSNFLSSCCSQQGAVALFLCLLC